MSSFVHGSTHYSRVAAKLVELVENNNDQLYYGPFQTKEQVETTVYDWYKLNNKSVNLQYGDTDKPEKQATFLSGKSSDNMSMLQLAEALRSIDYQIEMHRITYYKDHKVYDTLTETINAINACIVSNIISNAAYGTYLWEL